MRTASVLKLVLNARPSYLLSQTIELCGLEAFESAVLCTILTILFLRDHVAY